MIRKSVLAFLALPLIGGAGNTLTSCTSLTIDEPAIEQQQSNLCEVTINLSGLDFIIEADQAPATRATAAEAKVASIILTAYDNQGNAAFTITQSETDEGFGIISTKIPVGTYTFVAVAHGPATSPATISSKTEASFAGYLVNPFYSASQEVVIEGNTSQEVQMQMGKRITTTFGVKITDPTPPEAESLQIIISPSAVKPTAYVFTPATGFATETWRYERTFSKTERNYTTFTDISFNCLAFLTSAEQQLDVQINVLDIQGNVLYTRSKESVTFRQAARTVATGTFFSSSSSGSFIFDTTDNSAINIPLD